MADSVRRQGIKEIIPLPSGQSPLILVGGRGG